MLYSYKTSHSTRYFPPSIEIFDSRKKKNVLNKNKIWNREHMLDEKRPTEGETEGE